MDETRHALIVATARYSDAKLRQLRGPAADAEALAEVLRDPDKGDFEVQILADETQATLTRAIARFFHERRPQDLLLLHFSCHGVKDEDGELYLAASDTELDLLSATGISAAWLNERISRTRSRRTVLFLDCCFSGSFPSGLRRRGDDVDAPRQLEGRGRAIITASNAMEYAYEGEELKGEGRPSVFTEAVVEGLRTGRADLDQDRLISIDDLYRYVYDRVREQTPSQTPSIKSDLEGPLYLARSSYRAPVQPADLDPELIARTEDRYAGIREGAVQELAGLLASSDPAVAVAARDALLRMTSDDSRRVSARAQAALEAAEDAERAAPVAPVEREAGSPPAAPVTAARRRGGWVLAAAAALLAALVAGAIALLSGGGGGAPRSVIPAGDLMRNSSFEQGLAGWDFFQSKLSRIDEPNAPDGRSAVRVTATKPGQEYSIDDSPDTVQRSTEGQAYTATAWVKGTRATDGRPACISIRERPPGDGPAVSEGYGRIDLSAARYQRLAATYVAKGAGNRIDAYVFSVSSRQGGDAFLVDAFSMVKGGGVTTPGRC